MQKQSGGSGFCVLHYRIGECFDFMFLEPFSLRRWIKRNWLTWKYRKIDPNLCCCGCELGQGGSICHHGGCRSMKEYCITTEIDN